MNCIAKEAYTQWVRDRVEEIMLPFPFEPSMSIPQPMLAIIPTSKVGKLKETIKILEKENADLRSNLGCLTKENKDMKLNLKQKRILTPQAVEESQEEHFKRRKVGDTLKGSIDSLFIKKTQLADAQYQSCKVEISFQDHLKKLREQS